MNAPSGSIIILNGPSSVGKTTLTLRLQQLLPVPFLRLALDDLIQMMPASTNQWDTAFGPEVAAEQLPIGFCFRKESSPHGELELRLHAGWFGQRIQELLGPLARTLVEEGCHVILDTVMLQPETLHQLLVLLGPGVRSCTIGLWASLSALEERELKRGDRTPGSARWQAERVHAGKEYDLQFWTDQQDLESVASAIVQTWSGLSI
jgi:chloramphenicol 3-O phosphotransferase